MSDIERYEDVQGFFGEHVTEAMRDLRVDAGAETQAYLVDLLSEFSVPKRASVLGESLAGLLQ